MCLPPHVHKLLECVHTCAIRDRCAGQTKQLLAADAWSAYQDLEPTSGCRSLRSRQQVNLDFVRSRSSTNNSGFGDYYVWGCWFVSPPNLPPLPLPSLHEGCGYVSLSSSRREIWKHASEPTWLRTPSNQTTTALGFTLNWAHRSHFKHQQCIFRLHCGKRVD